MHAEYPSLSQKPIKFISYKPRESRYIDFLNSHVTSCWSLDQRIIFDSLLHYVSAFPSLMLIFLQVEIRILFVQWPHKSTLLRCHAYLWVRAHPSMSPLWKVWWPLAFWLLKKKKTNFMVPFYGWGSTDSRLEPLRGGNLFFTTKFPETPGTHFIDLRRMKGWVDLGATQWFWTRNPWIRNPTT